MERAKIYKIVNKSVLTAILTLSLLAPTRLFALELGLHMDLTWFKDRNIRTTAIQKAKEINAAVSRNSFLWHKIEPNQGQLDWGIPDSVIEDLLSAGIEPLLCIYGSPSWANGVPPSTKDAYNYVPTQESQFQEWLNYYDDFVTAAITRYKGRVKKWELWNEQNEHFFWKPKPNIDQYVRWFITIEKTIKSIDPNAEVSIGGLSGLTCSGPDDYNGKEFLKLLYQRGVFPDIVAIHPYSSHAPNQSIQWENNFEDILLIRELMSAFGQAHKKLWVTEWGWPTNRVSEDVQGAWLEISLMRLFDLEYVSLATYFIDYDRPPEYFHGLFNDRWQPKASAAIFRNFASKPILPKPPLNFNLKLE